MVVRGWSDGGPTKYGPPSDRKWSDTGGGAATSYLLPAISFFSYLCTHKPLTT